MATVPVSGVTPPYYWPLLRTTRNGLGRVRAALIEAFGDRCQTCGRRGEVVDHDHFTGFVRGWLCMFCNHIVDDCPHPAGCPFAEYLNNPPATPLRLRHPKPSDDARNAQPGPYRTARLHPFT